ncbi:hypothetical protein NMG60_11001547 [Bertholletia excelsa]
MVDGESACFTVVFFDGVCEIKMGVRIYSSLDYKTFRLGLSQRLGISQNQMIVYLVNRNDSKSSTRTLITRKVDFSAIVRIQDSFFLVELKRARKSGMQKARQREFEFGKKYSVNQSPPVPEKFFLLRRNQPVLNNQLCQDQIAPPEFALHNERWQNLQIQRQKYEMVMSAESNLNKNPSAGLNLDLLPRTPQSLKVSTASASNPPFCNECSEARKKGTTALFHCCVYDVVTTGFRPTAGPIARPRRASSGLALKI